MIDVGKEKSYINILRRRGGGSNNGKIQWKYRESNKNPLNIDL